MHHIILLNEDKELVDIKIIDDNINTLISDIDTISNNYEITALPFRLISGIIELSTNTKVVHHIESGFRCSNPILVHGYPASSVVIKRFFGEIYLWEL